MTCPLHSQQPCSHRCKAAMTPLHVQPLLRLSHFTPSRAPRSQLTCRAAGMSSATYNEQMKAAMGWEKADPFEYHFERGIYAHEVHPNLLCGSQPRHVADIDELKQELSVTAVLNLQQDKDFENWQVDFHSVFWHAKELGIDILRCPAVDFDPHSLRNILPQAAAIVHDRLQRGDRLYVHCTAGLGRAPAVCIAYLYWFQGMTLDAAYQHLTDIRPCGPNKNAIRGATYDLLDGRPFDEFQHLPEHAWTDLSQQQRTEIQQAVSCKHG